MNPKTMNNLTYGLFVLTASTNGKDNGCIINTAQQLTVNPNRISITVNKSNLTHDMILESNKFTVSVISEKADFSLFERFGFHSGRDTDKFAGFTEWKRGYNGVPYITQGTNAFLSAWVEQTIDLGTHTMFIAMITDMEVLTDDASVTYAYYHAHVKPQPGGKKNADKTIWRCTICGYEYEGEEIPADYICPLCKHPASDFEKVH